MDFVPGTSNSFLFDDLRDDDDPVFVSEHEIARMEVNSIQFDRYVNVNDTLSVQAVVNAG